MNVISQKLLDLGAIDGKWLKTYQDLCVLKLKRGNDKKHLQFLTHAHHIIPRCLAGSDDPANIVLLTPREHRLAHLLLVKIFPKNNSLKGALVFFLPKDLNGNLIISKHFNRHIEEFYKSLGEHNSKMLTGRTKEQNDGYRKISNALTGRTKETHEYLSQTAKKLTGRTKETHAGPKKHSDKMKGRTKENDNGMRKMSQTLSGRTKETHSHILEHSEKLHKLNLQQRQELLNLMQNGMKPHEVVEYFKLVYNIHFHKSLPIRHFAKFKENNAY